MTGPVDPAPALPLSVLDLSPLPAGGTGADALRNTLDLAQACDAAGYHRYWVAEHHLNPGLAAASTPVLVALLAAATQRVRVGSGAVQLPNSPPLLVAEQFGTIAAVHPGRVDLGLGRFDLRKIINRRTGKGRGGGSAPATRVVDGLVVPAPPTVDGDVSTYELLGRLLDYRLDEPAPDYAEQVGAVLGFLGGTYPGPFGAASVPPAEAGAAADLEVWILGSGPGSSADAAGAAGLPFAAAYHIVPTTALDAVEAYRAAFRPSEDPWGRAEAHVMVSADVVVADDDETARRLAAPYAEWVLDIRTGRGAHPYVTPEAALARPWTDAERAAVRDRTETQFVGSPATVVEQLRTLARVTGADEVLVTSVTTEHGDRVRSHELLAKAWAEQ